MKKYFFLFFFFIPFLSFTQFHIAGTSNDVSSALTKVLQDFPNHFNTIRGEIISQDVQAVNYMSTVNITGADSSIIIQNGSDSDYIYSWREVVFNAEDFDEAKQKFHEYFSKIKGTSVNINNKKVGFNADYIAPDDAKRFTTILFTPDEKTQQLKNVAIDLSMQYVLSGWQISISIYEHTDYGVSSDEEQ